MRASPNPPSADPSDFFLPLLRIEEKPPPVAGWMLRLLIGLVAGLILLATLGQLDVVAVSEGKLVPSSCLQIVQPPETGDRQGNPGEGRAACSRTCSRRCSRRFTTPDASVEAAREPDDG